MSKLFLATLLLAVPTMLGADSTAPQRVVREFAANSSVQDWWLDGGWTWNDGTLTHWPGSGKGVAAQRAMPSLTQGHTYAINFALGSATQGKVTVSMGKVSSLAYGWPGDTFPVVLTVSDPNALLTFTPTSDYDGSISHIRVVELGDELVTADTWTLTEGWSEESGAFRHKPGESASISSNVAAIAGHTYRVYYGVSDATDSHPEWTSGVVSLGGTKTGWFKRGGNYSFDILAAEDGPLVINPVDPKSGQAGFDGAISRISVREILSEPVPATATPTGQ